MSDLLRDTIARLEASSGDRELDAAIYVGVYKSAYPDETDEARIERARVCAPHYTSSIDAALTLVPEGWEWQVSNRAPKPDAGRAYIHNRELINISGGMTHNPKYQGAESIAANPAIALCIASLRARASLKARTAQ